MLDIITKSKIRKKILRLFFANKEKQYYLSEIANFINASVGNTQRELNIIKKQDILYSKKRGNMHYYFINKNNSLIKELENIINKTIGIEVELTKIMKQIKNIKFAFIFGSYVRGGFDNKSDIDLFIIGNPDESQLIKKLKIVENSIDKEINYHIFSVEDFKNKRREDSFIDNILKDYILLTDNKNEFRRLLK